MTEVRLLEGDALGQLFSRVARIYSSLKETPVHSVRPYGLFETLLQAYPGYDADALMAHIDSLAADHGPDVLRVIEDHSPGAPDYLEAWDRLYACPEVLLVADLARHYPARLRAVAGPSDYAAILGSMASELNGK